ncbi:MAG: hypothetical protein ACRCYU_18695 [Nocardioides sp.]
MSNTMAKDKPIRTLRAPAEGLLTGGRRAATSPAGGQRRRSWGLVTLAALLVIGAGLSVAAWGLHAGQRESVLAVSESIAKGRVISRDDMVSTSVSGVDGAIPVAQIDTVVGETAVVDLVDGQILTTAMIASSPVPGAGQATIGLALDPTRVPGAGLAPGDVVDVIAVPASDTAQSDPAALDTPEILAKGAEVYSVEGAAAAGGQVLVTLIVDASDAGRISAYSTQNRIAVVEMAPAGAQKAGE